MINSNEDLEDVFKYHAPNDIQKAQYEQLRSAAKDFAHTILLIVPPSADRSAAFRHLRECVMTANAAIALDGRH